MDVATENAERRKTRSLHDGSPGPRERSPLRFVALVFGLSVPFWLAGELTDYEVLPGLPVSSFAWVTPAIAAVVLVRREQGTGAVRGVLGRELDPRTIARPVWYLPMLFVMPGTVALSYAVLRLAGRPLPPPSIGVLPTLGLSAAFLATGAAEELGWSGYATEPLQQRLGALPAAIVLGAVTAVWHGVPLVQADRSPEWIAWWSLWTVAQRILIVWLFNNTGHNVFAASVFHASGNVAWQTLPVRGSSFDPRVNGILLAVVAVVVVVIWGPRTLTGRASRGAALRSRR